MRHDDKELDVATIALMARLLPTVISVRGATNTAPDVARYAWEVSKAAIDMANAVDQKYAADVFLRNGEKPS